MTTSDIAFDGYYDYVETARYLQALAAAHPDLATLSSLGRTFESREIWLIEITNPRTGPASSNPGYCIDAQIAEEHETIALAL